MDTSCKELQGQLAIDHYFIHVGTNLAIFCFQYDMDFFLKTIFKKLKNKRILQKTTPI